MKEEIKNLLLQASAEQHLSEFDQEELTAWMKGDLEDEEFFESENTCIWEPYEREDSFSMSQRVWDFYDTLKHLVERVKEIQDENN
jgi:hypothetical protein